MNPSAYTRPNKPTRVHVKRRTDKTVQPVDVPQVVAVDRATECHVTPAGVAARMVDYLELTDTSQVLEPEAGTGNLIAALLAAGCSANHIAAIEMHHDLASLIRARFDGQVTVTQMDFLGMHSGEMFDRVIMNPPFRGVRQHVARAVQALKAGGVLVALVPITFNHAHVETLETLDNTTFASAKVSTKIIRIEV